MTCLDTFLGYRWLIMAYNFSKSLEVFGGRFGRSQDEAGCDPWVELRKHVANGDAEVDRSERFFVVGQNDDQRFLMIFV